MPAVSAAIPQRVRLGDRLSISPPGLFSFLEASERRREDCAKPPASWVVQRLLRLCLPLALSPARPLRIFFLPLRVSAPRRLIPLPSFAASLQTSVTRSGLSHFCESTRAGVKVAKTTRFPGKLRVSYQAPRGRDPDLSRAAPHAGATCVMRISPAEKFFGTAQVDVI